MSMSSSTFDPLNAAGGVGGASQSSSMSTLNPGEFVEALTDKTALFNSRPSANDTASRLLSRGTTMKVISDDGSYAKVELDDGTVGFVPSIQLGNGAGSMVADPTQGSEVQVWPPVDTIPLPAGEGQTAPGEAMDGAPTLPPVIEPDAPAELPPLPDDAPTPGLGAEPAVEMTPPAEAAEDAVGDDAGE